MIQGRCIQEGRPLGPVPQTSNHFPHITFHNFTTILLKYNRITIHFPWLGIGTLKVKRLSSVKGTVSQNFSSLVFSSNSPPGSQLRYYLVIWNLFNFWGNIYIWNWLCGVNQKYVLEIGNFLKHILHVMYIVNFTDMPFFY